jgi:hypothetical protein
VEMVQGRCRSTMHGSWTLLPAARASYLDARLGVPQQVSLEGQVSAQPPSTLGVVKWRLLLLPAWQGSGDACKTWCMGGAKVAMQDGLANPYAGMIIGLKTRWKYPVRC